MRMSRGRSTREIVLAIVLVALLGGFNMLAATRGVTPGQLGQYILDSIVPPRNSMEVEAIGLRCWESAQSPCEPVDLHAYLPTLEQIDGEWSVQSEGERSREEVIELLGTQGEELIDTLGWRANAFHNFERTNVTDPNSFYEPVQITVSIHAFADSDGAADALGPLSDWVANSDGMESVSAESSGDRALAFSGLDGRLPAFVLYVQEGNLVIRIGAISMLGEPRDAVLTVSELVLEKATA